jgi:hypothetical protein
MILRATFASIDGYYCHSNTEVFLPSRLCEFIHVHCKRSRHVPSIDAIVQKAEGEECHRDHSLIQIKPSKARLVKKRNVSGLSVKWVGMAPGNIKVTILLKLECQLCLAG